MELAEAIKHAEKVAAGHEKNCELLKPECEAWAANKKAGEENRKLAEWLKKLEGGDARMTSEEQDKEALKWFQDNYAEAIFQIGDPKAPAYDRAIKALDRRQAKDIRINEGRRECPRCGDRIRITGPGGVPNDYCGNCGQKLSWKNDTQRMPWE